MIDETQEPYMTTEEGEASAPSSSDQILSTEEVGALFEAVQSSGSGDDEPAPADADSDLRPFEPPPVETGSAELRRLVARVHGVFAIEAGAALGALLRMPVGLEMGTAAEPDPNATLAGDEVRISLSASGTGFAALLLDSTLVRAAADRAMGGPGTPSAPNRPLTDLEKKVSQRALATLSSAFASAWRPWLVAEPTASAGIEERSRGLSGPFLCAAMRLRLGELDVAGTALYAVGPLAVASGVAPGTAAGDGAQPTLARRLDALPLRVLFQAPGFTLSIAELLGLAPGMTLAVARTDELRVEARVEGTPRFRGRLVVDSSGVRTVAIDEPILAAAR